MNPKVLTKDISYECKCKFSGRECNSYQKCKNPATCSCESDKYFASITDNSVIMFDEIIEETKTVPPNCNANEVACKTQNSIFYLHFY